VFAPRKTFESREAAEKWFEQWLRDNGLLAPEGAESLPVTVYATYKIAGDPNVHVERHEVDAPATLPRDEAGNPARTLEEFRAFLARRTAAEGVSPAQQEVDLARHLAWLAETEGEEAATAFVRSLLPPDAPTRPGEPALGELFDPLDPAAVAVAHEAFARFYAGFRRRFLPALEEARAGRRPSGLPEWLAEHYTAEDFELVREQVERVAALVERLAELLAAGAPEEEVRAVLAELAALLREPEAVRALVLAFYAFPDLLSPADFKAILGFLASVVAQVEVAALTPAQRAEVLRRFDLSEAEEEEALRLYGQELAARWLASLLYALLREVPDIPYLAQLLARAVLESAELLLESGEPRLAVRYLTQALYALVHRNYLALKLVAIEAVLEALRSAIERAEELLEKYKETGDEGAKVKALELILRVIDLLTSESTAVVFSFATLEQQREFLLNLFRLQKLLGDKLIVAIVVTRRSNPEVREFFREFVIDAIKEYFEDKEVAEAIIKYLEEARAGGPAKGLAAYLFEHLSSIELLLTFLDTAKEHYEKQKAAGEPVDFSDLPKLFFEKFGEELVKRIEALIETLEELLRNGLLPAEQRPRVRAFVEGLRVLRRFLERLIELEKIKSELSEEEYKKKLEEIFEEVEAEADPENPFELAFFSLIRILLDEGGPGSPVYEEALARLERAVELDPALRFVVETTLRFIDWARAQGLSKEETLLLLIHAFTNAALVAALLDAETLAAALSSDPAAIPLVLPRNPNVAKFIKRVGDDTIIVVVLFGLRTPAGLREFYDLRIAYLEKTVADLTARADRVLTDPSVPGSPAEREARAAGLRARAREAQLQLELTRLLRRLRVENATLSRNQWLAAVARESLAWLEENGFETVEALLATEAGRALLRELARLLGEFADDPAAVEAARLAEEVLYLGDPEAFARLRELLAELAARFAAQPPVPR
uniref:De novo designed Protein K10 n=1 Tax=synthetic construct TaxID=32630 RepID=UPI003704D4D4